jgi:hypothetical protein
MFSLDGWITRAPFRSDGDTADQAALNMELDALAGPWIPYSPATGFGAQGVL